MVLALVLLAAAAAAPLLDRPLRRVVADPVLPVAVIATVLLASAGSLAAAADESRAWERGVLAALAVAVAGTAGSHVVRAVFRLTRRELWPSRPAADAESDSASRPEPIELERTGSVLRGGAWIGYLERVAAASAVLAGFPEGLALILAVKGVGRYPELRDAGSAGQPDTHASEAFIIGTLTSFLWAVACARVAALPG